MTAVGLTTLRSGWAVLSRPTHDEYASYPLDLLESVDIRLAVDRDNGRHLLVEFPGEPSPLSQPNSPLIDRVWSLTFGGQRRSYLDVACLNSGLWEVFDDLIVDVLQIAWPAPQPGAAVKSALESWRALFKTGLIRSLSRERRFGLFAELLVLQAAVTLASAGEIVSWVGPGGAPHDFEFVHSCVEVKAVGTSSTRTRIHGLSQLEPHDPKPLDLIVLTVIEREDGQSISSLVEGLTAAGVGARELRGGLSQSGWTSDSDFDEPLAIAEVLHVRVGAETPRITTSALLGGIPEGVSDISYEVDLSTLAEHGTGHSLSEIIATAVLP
jgi:hypothetical protein